MNNSQQIGPGESREPEMLQPTIDALEGLSIIARLEFAANLLFDRVGGDRTSIDPNWSAGVATETVRSVIDVLKAHPNAANLRAPEPLVRNLNSD